MRLLPLLLLVNLASAPVLPASAQSYPAKPLRIVIGFAAGGGADILARTLAPRLGEALGQSVVIDNRPGAAGHIANEHVARSAPDGYTLLMGSPGLVTYRSLYAKQTYDPERDLTPVSLVGVVPNLLVLHPSVPAHTVKQLIALARGRPGRFNYASPGIGTSLHLAAELFKAMAKVEIIQIVYKGGAPAVADLMGGHVDLMFDVLPSSLPHVKSGRLRAIGITIGHRSALLPEVPTVAESGLPGYQAITWNGLLAPAATPREITEKLAAELARVLRTPEMKERFVAIGTETASNTPEQFRTFLREETDKWTRVIRDAGIKLE